MLMLDVKKMMVVNCKKIISLIVIFMAWCQVASCHVVSYEEHVVDLRVDDASHTITVYMDDALFNEIHTEKDVKKAYKKVTKDVRHELPRQYRDYDVRIQCRGMLLEALLSSGPHEGDDKKHHKRRHGGWWDKVWYDGNPWVTNLSRPNRVSAALNGKHISLWASHGRYYDVAQSRWKWQRPNLFCTTEDMFTQTFVVPFLIPMLENAGAVVFSPRERDWQIQEVIVDNDEPASGYTEYRVSGRWADAAVPGFANPMQNIPDGYNPFEKGKVRQVSATHNENCSRAVYKPSFSQSGRYAVYVSYATVDNSVSDAHYTVCHKGIRTDFRVNQRMGGSTWVYLGTFDFEAGCSEDNCVVVSALSGERGVVTTDAVRFGGGMGSIERGGSVSGLPRCLEGARYYAQWAGLPYETLSLYNGEDDYKDDINVRSLMTNWLAGGSVYAPSKQGKAVPIDLSLAVHSDAGFNKDFTSIFGSLAVCTTDANDGLLDARLPRSHSKDFAQMLLDRSKKDIESHYGSWRWRSLYDKNYSETRLPAMPSAIFETLSHQSFPDMRLAHDPDFKFTLARSIYKSILSFEAEAHGEKAVVSPLAPVDFRISLDNAGNALLQWSPQYDMDESTAVPSSYNVYCAMGVRGFDNGVNMISTQCSVKLIPDLCYRFRVTAVNDGGESFPTQELAVVWHGAQYPSVLVFDGFQRLAAPEVVSSDSIKGFDISSDPGLSYGMTAGWCGRQTDFSVSSSSFGVSGTELEGRFVAGNSFDYVAEHVQAIASAYKYNVVSASRSSIENRLVSLAAYDVVDLMLGNERNDGYSLKSYKTFTPSLQTVLADYLSAGIAPTITGRHGLFVSGSYVASDMQTDAERRFLADCLSLSYDCSVRPGGYVSGFGQTCVVTDQLNPDHYAVTRADVLIPINGAFPSMLYAGGQTAAIVRKSGVPVYVMGFPLECITNSSQRSYIMRGILDFLLGVN